MSQYKMDELLRPVSRTYVTSEVTEEPLLQNFQASSSAASAPQNFKPTSLDDVLEALSHEPDYDTLISALRFVARAGPGNERFDIGAPGPQAARIIQILVTEIVPNYWAVLKESSSEGDTSDIALLLDSLRNLAGLNAILLRLRTLTQEQKAQTTDVKHSDVLLNLRIILELLCEILGGDDSLSRLWANTSATADAMKQRILSKDFVNVIAGGRTISFSAEAESLISQETKGQIIWVADGMEYTKWLTRNIISWSKRAELPAEKKLLADLLSKALRLGYSGMSPTPSSGS